MVWVLVIQFILGCSLVKCLLGITNLEKRWTSEQCHWFMCVWTVLGSSFDIWLSDILLTLAVFERIQPCFRGNYRSTFKRRKKLFQSVSALLKDFSICVLFSWPFLYLIVFLAQWSEGQNVKTSWPLLPTLVEPFSCFDPYCPGFHYETMWLK